MDARICSETPQIMGTPDYATVALISLIFTNCGCLPYSASILSELTRIIHPLSQLSRRNTDLVIIDPRSLLTVPATCTVMLGRNQSKPPQLPWFISPRPEAAAFSRLTYK